MKVYRSLLRYKWNALNEQRTWQTFIHLRTNFDKAHYNNFSCINTDLWLFCPSISFMISQTNYNYIINQYFFSSIYFKTTLMTVLRFDIPELETSLATPKQDLVQVSAWVHYGRHFKWHFVKCYLQVLLCGKNTISCTSQELVKLENQKSTTDHYFNQNIFYSRFIGTDGIKYYPNVMLSILLQHQPSDSTSQTTTTLSLSTEITWSPKGSRRWTSAPWPVYVWTTWIDATSQSV